ncbi:hypothetical protein Tmar_0677 [Thermaerobacter marianensis DSM 12885]|uniref:Uncharacterized protein n=1 Tax=Thermaerobacter marianensis (strain ATCC 700841 / DSM 12885 / JCM 10246 / 7p75a) TaxID=644966 RepID=E6SHU7_THEM7|nr:hypothetical protein [Thermaerobacter marianensis]ADU50794.1 hypothetical protein Tmar_0677 [Thermaerobacter marianensis DSM 12885]
MRAFMHWFLYVVWAVSLDLMAAALGLLQRLTTEAELQVRVDGDGMGYYFFPFVAWEYVPSDQIIPHVIRLVRAALWITMVYGLARFVVDLRLFKRGANRPSPPR